MHRQKMCSELKEKCQGLQVKNFNICATYQHFQEEYQITGSLLMKMEQKCLEKEVMHPKIKGEYRSFQQGKSNLELKAKEAVELGKVNF